MILETILDEELKTPGGDLSPKLRNIFGQESIDRQASEIKSKQLKCGLIWYLCVSSGTTKVTTLR